MASLAFTVPAGTSSFTGSFPVSAPRVLCDVRGRRFTSKSATSAPRMVAMPLDPTTIIDKEYDPSVPNDRGRYGRFGGRYVPETLMASLIELEAGYKKHCNDPEFKKELKGLLKDFVGRPSPLYFAERLTQRYARPDGSGPKIYLKVRLPNRSHYR